jgi:hypothetical protein
MQISFDEAINELITFQSICRFCRNPWQVNQPVQHYTSKKRRPFIRENKTFIISRLLEFPS